MNSPCLVLLAILSVACLAGCKPHPKSVTDLQRKEAAHADSEAQFAVTLRQWERAEGLYAKAAELCPDTGQYWLNLGAARVRLGKRDAAKTAYRNGLKAFEDEASAHSTDLEPWLKQVETLALLGRVDEGRALLEKVSKRFPNERTLRAYLEDKSFDGMLADPAFKESAL